MKHWSETDKLTYSLKISNESAVTLLSSCPNHLLNLLEIQRHSFVLIVKMARVVKLKSAFLEFFYNSGILIKLYKIRYLN